MLTLFCTFTLWPMATSLPTYTPWPKLQPLLGYLPEAQREPMLALLRQLDARQLEQLGLLSQRTPPQEREALREELLATPAATRSEWLRRKLGE